METEEIEALIKEYPNIGPRYSARENEFMEKNKNSIIPVAAAGYKR